jgi:DNA-binding transcriptional regulator YiaG
MSKKLSFKEAIARPGATEDGAPGRSASPMIKLLLTSGPISRPVDVIRLLAQHGLSLKKARATVDKLGAGERVAVELHLDSLQALVLDLSRLGVLGRAFRAQAVDVKRVREAQHLSQGEFAALYGLELDTLQNWEQGRNAPDTSTRVLLKLIEQCPHVVLDAMTEDVLSSQNQDH